MKKVNEFVLEENPHIEDKDDKKGIISILDSIYMHPIERELIKYRLEKEILVMRDLPYRADLVIEYIEYHIENEQIPIIIAVLGLDKTAVDGILSGFEEVLSSFAFARYTPLDLVGPYPDGIIGMVETYLKEYKIRIEDFKKTYLLEYKASDIRRRNTQTKAGLYLEFLGYKRQDEKTIVYCMIYDRHYTMHGYVALKI